MINKIKVILFGIRVQGEKVSDVVGFRTTLPTNPLSYNDTWKHIYSILK